MNLSPEETEMKAARLNNDRLLYFAYCVDLGKVDEVERLMILASGGVGGMLPAFTFLKQRFGDKPSLVAELLKLRAERLGQA